MKWISSLLLILFFCHDIALAELPRDYENWSHLEKQAFLWKKKIIPTAYRKLSPLSGAGWGDLLNSGMSLITLGKSFDHASDEIPAGRRKFIHPFGSVVKVKYISRTDHPYTGLFKGGIGLARFSLAGDPSVIGYTPGVAIKFFLDGYASVNIHMMHSLDGQGENQNFFAYAFGNDLPPPKSFILWSLEKWFSLFKEHPRYLPVAHLAVRDQEGAEIKNPKSPAQLILVPTKHVQINPKTQKDFRVELAEIMPESHLYTVWAMAASHKKRHYLGDIVTTSPFIASEYGDRSLFFKHQR